MTKPDQTYKVFRKEDDKDVVVREYGPKQGATAKERLAKAKEFVEKNKEQGFFLKGGESSAPDAADEESEDETETYADLSIDELKAEVQARKLEAPAKAKKADLVALLEANDAENNEDEE